MSFSSNNAADVLRVVLISKRFHALMGVHNSVSQSLEGTYRSSACRYHAKLAAQTPMQQSSSSFNVKVGSAVKGVLLRSSSCREQGAISTGSQSKDPSFSMPFTKCL
jgi:hypothetical protein